MAVGLGPLALSSMGRCGHVELGGLEFDGARMAGVCVDRGNRSGWRLGADFRPQTCSYPWQLLPGDWPGEMSLRARVGRAAGLWLSPCCPPALFLFCIEAAPGMRRVPLPNLSSLCLICGVPRPPFLPSPGVSAQPPPSSPAALGFRRADKQSPGPAAPTSRLSWWGGLSLGSAAQRAGEVAGEGAAGLPTAAQTLPLSSVDPASIC